MGSDLLGMKIWVILSGWQSGLARVLAESEGNLKWEIVKGGEEYHLQVRNQL